MEPFTLVLTNNLKRRVGEHKSGIVEGFTKKYILDRLVYFEIHDEINEAISREKRIMKWNRDWEIKLIEKMNSEWNDLYDDLF
jgi:putative endonuclease